MGFLDKAKAAANDLTAKADTALASSGMGGPASTADADRHLRDLGVLSYLEATGRPAPAEERTRIVAALRGMESAGSLGTLALRTGAVAPAAPPPPGAAPPPPSATGAAPPPPSTAATPPPPPAGAAPPPPPPPSWAKDEGAQG